LLFVFAVVATPSRAVPAFVLYAICVGTVARLSRVRLRFIARRLVFEIPFLAFALLLPFLSSGERSSVLGLSLSEPGLWAAWNIAIKATLGLAVTVLLGATTPVSEILHGLERLRVPGVITTIAHFMIRYADIITGEMHRMRIARESRGYKPSFLWHARALAASLGSLFVRSYERGERVYLAMVARGYAGSIPVTGDHRAGARQWSAALSLPAVAAVIAAVSWATLG
jgi:cobalt/nickel transport system permease protein